jgi:hypothetical protein
MSSRGKRRRLLAVLAGVVAAVAVAALLWPREGDVRPEARKCWALLSELDIESSESLSECGDALESVITGEAPGHKAPEGEPEKLPKENGDALELVVSTYADQLGSARVPQEIVKNLSNALTYFPKDLYDILSGHVDYSDPSFSTSPNDIDIEKSAMRAFLRALAEDEDSFKLIREAIFGQVERDVKSLQKQDLDHEPEIEPGESYRDRALGVAQSSGEAVGMLRGERFDALRKQYRNDDEAAKEALVKDYNSYGLPRLRTLFTEHAAALRVTRTEVGKSRFESLLSEVEAAYARGTG